VQRKRKTMSKQTALNTIGTLLACAIVLFSKSLTKRATDGFTIHAIQSIFPSDPQWNVSFADKPPLEFHTILNQSFRYLAKGAQCYVFISEDGQYVLKFFNQVLYKRKGQEERNKDFLSYTIAYDHFREETGLVYLHLAPEQTPLKKITLIDRLNIAHDIELGSLEFLLQKRAHLAVSSITTAMIAHKEDDAKKVLNALFDLTRKRLEKGILDRDPNITKNLGILEDKALQIDVGRFYLATSPDQFKTDLAHFKTKNAGFLQWLESNHPSLLPFYLEQYSLLEQYYLEKFSIESRSAPYFSCPQQEEQSGPQ